MAIRYSGDAEVRLQWSARRRCYVGSVRCPLTKPPWRGTTTKSFWHRNPRDSKAYDAAARDLLSQANRASRQGVARERKLGRIRVRRVFQAPCPTGMIA